MTPLDEKMTLDIIRVLPRMAGVVVAILMKFEHGRTLQYGHFKFASHLSHSRSDFQ
jgi:hypothetical protein